MKTLSTIALSFLACSLIAPRALSQSTEPSDKTDSNAIKPAVTKATASTQNKKVAAKKSNLASSIARGKQLYFQNNCQSCHTIGGQGAKFGPALDKLGAHANKLELTEEIHGGADEPEMDFKTRHLTREDQRAIIDYLLSVQTKTKGTNSGKAGKASKATRAATDR